MTPAERFATARVARLATVGPGNMPHLVPIVFAIIGDTIHTAVDAKPKRTRDLRRLANIASNPQVTVLADHYDDQDWSQLWWVRADGAARVFDKSDETLDALVAKYPQYRSAAPAGPYLQIAVGRWTSWVSAHHQ